MSKHAKSIGDPPSISSCSRAYSRRIEGAVTGLQKLKNVRIEDLVKIHIHFFYTSNQYISNLCSEAEKIKQLLRLRYHLLLKKCIVFPFFHCFLGKCTQMHGILSNFEPKIRKKFKQLLRLRRVSGCLYKKSVVG